MLKELLDTTETLPKNSKTKLKATFAIDETPQPTNNVKPLYPRTAPDQNKDLETHSAFDNLDEFSFKVHGNGENKQIKLPNVTLGGNETLIVTIKKVKDVNSEFTDDTNLSSTPPSHRSIMETQTIPSGEKELVMMRSESMIYKILNIAFTVFSIASIAFLVMAIFNVVLTRSDSLFGFFLCGITGLMFKADQVYRRSFNK